VRADRPDPADESGDAGMTGNPRSSDAPDAPGKDREGEAGPAGRPGLPSVIRDAALRTEQTVAYRAKVEAVYRQHDADRGQATAKEPARETVTFAMHPAEAAGRHPQLRSARFAALDKSSYAASCRATVDAVYDAHQAEAAESAVWKTRDGDYSSSDQPTLRLPSARPEGKLFHADADPLRVFGPASETHPEEFQEAMARLGDAGVEVDLRPGVSLEQPVSSRAAARKRSTWLQNWYKSGAGTSNLTSRG
jgi:hypothetical protein